MNTKTYLPSELVIDITGGCNARCPMCSRQAINDFEQKRPSGHMDQTTYLEALHEAKAVGVKQVRLYWWGEPTLHPHLDRCIDQVLEFGFHCTVSTNGLRVDKYMDALLRAHWVRFSIDGHDEASFAFLRKGLDFHKVHDNLMRLYQLRNEQGIQTKISIGTSINRFTDFYSFLHHWGTYCDEITFNPMLPVSFYDARRQQIVAHKMPELQGYYYDFERIANYQNKKCGYLSNAMIVNHDGRFALCCEDITLSQKLGSIQDGIRNVYNSEGFNKVRQQFVNKQLTLCDGCQIFFTLTPESRAEINARMDEALARYNSLKQNKLPTIIRAY